MGKARPFLALLSVVAVTFVTTGTVRYAHEKAAHSVSGPHASSVAGDHDHLDVAHDDDVAHDENERHEQSPAQPTDDHNPCLTCVALAAVREASSIPAADVGLLLDAPPTPHLPPLAYFPPAAPSVVATAPRGPPAV